MTIQQLAAKEIALTQLETALRLFLEGRDFISTITLAGAAEEILGGLVTKGGGKPSLIRRAENKRAAFFAVFPMRGNPGIGPFIDLTNKPRNTCKHFTGRPLSADAKVTSARFLKRAVENYYLLYKHHTPAMARFQRVYFDVVGVSKGYG